MPSEQAIDQSGAEKREHQRVTLKTNVSLASESNFYTGFCGNISSGGIFVATYSSVAIGTELDLEFSLSDEEEAIKVRGDVRWIRDFCADNDVSPGIGIRFTQISAPDQERIERFIAKRDTLFYDE